MSTQCYQNFNYDTLNCKKLIVTSDSYCFIYARLFKKLLKIMMNQAWQNGR